ncbi:MAG TPA: plastocyanin/azurin family copper-binding protein, partial [Candidatus Limnocylindrales bacterium]
MRRPTIAFVAIVVATLTLGACASTASTWTYAPATQAPAAHEASLASGAPAASPVGAAASPSAAGAPVGTIEIEAFDLGFKPAQVAVDAPGTYTVAFHNTGGIVHDVTFADGSTIRAEAGQSAEGVVVVPEGGIGFICSIPGHEAGGMTGTVAVGGSAGHAAGGDDHGGP